MRLVERHVIKRADRRFKAIDRAAFASKNLYNKALYATRQAFFQDGAYPTYPTLYHQMKGEPEYAAPAALAARRQAQMRRRFDRRAVKTASTSSKRASRRHPKSGYT